jgi:uncharacterized protein YyaL (SSP411 family)
MNRLAQASSLYLRQHGNNPVDWWEWSEEALAEARRRDVPLMLSIGYASCHWCHVMERESFENPAIAAELNRVCVPIKVDREERPDIDAMYMEAVTASTGSGGWPMTIFATPDGRPFFAGTYFPPSAHSGMTGFDQLIGAVDDAWTNRRAEIEHEAAQLADAIARRTVLPRSQVSSDDIDIDALLRETGNDLLRRIDMEWGGFGNAPKFPQPYLLETLMTLWQLTAEDRYLDAATAALDAMARGGIFDHVEGGFARYSTDRFWIVPHFEKMLYDQSGLLSTYAEAFAITGNEDFAYVADRIVTYVESTLRQPNGSYGASQDADSDHEEGTYYVFRIEEIADALGDDANLLIATYGVTKSGNFEGRNILHRSREGTVRPTDASLSRSLERLATLRKQRTAPVVDPKSIGEWTADYVGALYRCAGLLQRPEWLQLANEGLERLIQSHLDDQLHVSRLPLVQETVGTAGDAFALVGALVDAYEATGLANHALRARDIALHAIEEYHDPHDGGLFTGQPDPTGTVIRIKDVYDGAGASVNARACAVLLRLGTLFDDHSLLDVAHGILAYVREGLTSQPGAFASFAISHAFAYRGLRELVIPGPGSPELVALARSAYLPDVVLATGERLPGGLFDDRVDGVAYLCRRRSCDVPTNSTETLAMQLGIGTLRRPMDGHTDS